MNALLPRFMKSLYRKEPISSFILIAGTVDAVMGGVGDRLTLFGFGLTVIMVGIFVRWWQNQPTSLQSPPQRPQRYLPPSSSPQPLPTLKSNKRRSPY